MSNWLEPNIDSYKLRFNISDKTSEILSLKVFSLDDKMIRKQLKEIITSSNQFVIPIQKSSNSFRIIFEVKVASTNKKSEASFILSAIDVGDGCVKEDLTENDCTLNRGECFRSGVNNYTCKCDSGYAGENCEYDDYCTKLKLSFSK
jgi:hypothetical protein